VTRIAKINTSIITGLDAVPVQVEVRIAQGNKPRFTIVGLGDSALREARERVLCALASRGFKVPSIILVNLAPAELKKEGASLDLAIATGILVASRQAIAPPDLFLYDMFIHGELSLDGCVKPIRGTLAHIITAHAQRASRIIVPYSNLTEAQLIPEAPTVGIKTLGEIPAMLAGEDFEPPPLTVLPPQEQNTRTPIFSDVWGQQGAKRALEIAAAGGHNVLMQGPPGCGKSLLARKFPSLLPDMSTSERLEVVKIHSIAGRPVESILGGTRPLCSPHHGVTQAGLIGGGSNSPTPGDISLAHRGVLFLDELPEFSKTVLEGLRGPLETGAVELRRARYRATFPAKFQLIAAMNRCPCGRLGAKSQECLCSPASITAYQQKVSQPLRDRIDLHVTLQGVRPEEFLHCDPSESASQDQSLLTRIHRARDKQISRAGRLNADLRVTDLNEHLRLTPEAESLVHDASRRLALTARTFVRVLRVARTIADLADQAHTEPHAIAESLSFRE
jgi:magnesium chelatase family protein